MARNVGIVAALIMVMVMVASPVWAQPDYRVEVQAFGGYTFSEGVSVDERIVEGEIVNEVNPTSSGSFGGQVGVFVTEGAEIGFRFSQQLSTFEIKGISSREVTDMKVNNYHATFGLNFGPEDEPLRPFFFIGLGATQYQPDDVMGQPVDSRTRFSSTFGGGVKVLSEQERRVQSQGGVDAHLHQLRPGRDLVQPLLAVWVLPAIERELLEPVRAVRRRQLPVLSRGARFETSVPPGAAAQSRRTARKPLKTGLAMLSPRTPGQRPLQLWDRMLSASSSVSVVSCLGQLRRPKGERG